MANTKNPTHEIFAVQNVAQGAKNQKARWNKIGVGWINSEGYITTSKFAHAAEGYNEVIKPIKANDNNNE